eukprot:1153233-Rhodomonas_salina.1
MVEACVTTTPPLLVDNNTIEADVTTTTAVEAGVTTGGCGDGILQANQGKWCYVGNNLNCDRCSADCQTLYQPVLLDGFIFFFPPWNGVFEWSPIYDHVILWKQNEYKNEVGNREIILAWKGLDRWIHVQKNKEGGERGGRSAGEHSRTKQTDATVHNVRDKFIKTVKEG